MNEERTGLGIIVPSANSVVERDYTRLQIPGVSFHFSRVFNSEDVEEQLFAMKENTREAAELLSHVRWIKAVALACTGGSFIGGAGYDEGLVEVMTEASGLPSATTSGSVIIALRALGMKKVAVFDPYPQWLSALLTTFLEAHDIDVVASHCDFGMTRTVGLDDYQPINDWIIPRVPDDADGVYIACTNFSWLRGIAPLERHIGRPVLTSNLATIWRLLQIGAVAGPVPILDTRLGKL